MSKGLESIWIAVGTMAFVFALFSDIYYWRTDWKDVELSTILLTLFSLIIVGLFIGLIPFRKKRYTTKIIVAIPLVSILFAFFIAATTINNEYGLTNKYNYFTAKQDLKKGKIQIITHGLILSSIEFDNEKAAIDNAFGFKTVWEGCTISNNGHSKYNKVMWDYLNKRNGEGWQKSYEYKIDSLMKIHQTL